MIVYHACPWLPAEWILAHGLTPRGLWFADDLQLQLASLSAGVCAWAQSAVQCAEGRSDAVFIFTTHCDQFRRGFDTVPAAHRDRCFLFNIPATWQTPVAERIFLAESRRLSDFLVRLGGQPPGAEALASIVRHYARARTQLHHTAGQTSARDFLEAVGRFYWDGPLAPGLISAASVEAATEPGRRAEGPVRLGLVGGPLLRSQWRLLEVIEASGGQVVLLATEPGERGLWSTTDLPVRDELPELLSFLARTYLEHCVDMFPRPNTRLYDWLGQRLQARGVRGLILWHYLGCDLWRAEARSIGEAFGLPVLLLEADTSLGGWQRITGRVQAFIEALHP